MLWRTRRLGGCRGCTADPSTRATRPSPTRSRCPMIVPRAGWPTCMGVLHKAGAMADGAPCARRRRRRQQRRRRRVSARSGARVGARVRAAVDTDRARGCLPLPRLGRRAVDDAARVGGRRGRAVRACWRRAVRSARDCWTGCIYSPPSGLRVAGGSCRVPRGGQAPHGPASGRASARGCGNRAPPAEQLPRAHCSGFRRHGRLLLGLAGWPRCVLGARDGTQGRC